MTAARSARAWYRYGTSSNVARHMRASSPRLLPTRISVGAHWFQYADQPVTGRLLDGENSHIGLVGITDIPFGGFVEAVRAANLKATRP